MTTALDPTLSTFHDLSLHGRAIPAVRRLFRAARSLSPGLQNDENITRSLRDSDRQDSIRFEPDPGWSIAGTPGVFQALIAWVRDNPGKHSDRTWN
jgi:hypothetical protein